MRQQLKNTSKKRTFFCLESAQSFGWLLLVFLTPLLFNIWGQQPFELPKTMWVRTLVWLLAGLVLTEYILCERARWHKWYKTPILATVALLALVIMVTTATAVNWQLSLWGSYERNQGAVTLLTYLLLFLLTANHFREEDNARPVIVVMAASSLPLILMSGVQQFGWQPFDLVSDARSPLFATLGRANFLGAYLAILVPLTLYLLLTSSRHTSRLYWLVLLLGDLVVIGLTLARSAWLATTVSLSIFFLLWLGNRLSRPWRISGWIGTGILILSGPLVVGILGKHQTGSIAARQTIWQGTIDLIKERPLLGYGADSLGLVFPRVYPPELVYYQGREYFVDRAHNLFLDLTVTTGIPGLLAFGLILITFCFLFVRAWRQPQPPAKRTLLAAIMAAILGMLTNSLTSFDVTSTALAFWLLLGMGVGLSQPITIPTRAFTKKRPFWQWSIVSVLVIGIGAAIWQINIRPLQADMAARTAYQYAQTGNWTESSAAANQAVKYWPLEPTHHLQLSQFYWQQAAADPTNAPIWLSQAETALQTARQLRPEDPALWLHTAQFYELAAQQFGQDINHLADTAYQQATSLAPNHATLYAAWGLFHMNTGDASTAALLLKKAVKLDASNGKTYLQLGAAELAQGHFDNALSSYLEAVRLLPESSQAYSGLAYCYWQLSQFTKAQWATTEALKRDPHNPQAITLRGATEKK